MSEATIENPTPTDTRATRGKTSKKGAKAKAAAPKIKPVKAAKPPREKKEKAPREDRTSWRTFALRLPASESAALHEAAGPANASRVMRALAGAFVAEDRAAFELIVEDARKLR